MTLSFRGQHPKELSFGTSGLRGLVTEITDLEAYINTRGFLEYLREQGELSPGDRVALAGDLRPSTHSPERSILLAVANAVRAAGFQPEFLGRIPTPALSLYGFTHGLVSIMVTGSHIPFDRNGIKFNRRNSEISKRDESAIYAQVARIRREEYSKDEAASSFRNDGFLKTEARGELPPESTVARQEYVRRYLDLLGEDALSGMRVVFFEHSAVGRDLIPELLSRLGAEVIRQGRSEEFVAIDTEAISEDQLSTMNDLLARTLAQSGRLDALLSTDGDSDRPLFIGLDEAGTGAFLPGDLLGVFTALSLEADSVAVPVSANDLIESVLGAASCHVTRTKIGSPFVIDAMSESRGARSVGFEANGGFLVGRGTSYQGRSLAPLPTRDSVLPMVLLLHRMKREGRRLPELLHGLPSRHGASGLIDGVAPEVSRRLLSALMPEDPSIRRANFTEKLTAHGDQNKPIAVSPDEEARLRKAHSAFALLLPSGLGALQELDATDGARMRFESGDVLHLRASGNAPQLRLYVLSGSRERAKQLLELGLGEPQGFVRRALLSGS